MIRQLKTIAAVVVAGSILVLSPVAQADEAELEDIGDLSCRDVLLAAGEDRDSIILVLHAYLLGEAKQLTFDPEVLSSATDDFLDACIAYPDKGALETMRKQKR